VCGGEKRYRPHTKAAVVPFAESNWSLPVRTHHTLSNSYTTWFNGHFSRLTRVIPFVGLRKFLAVAMLWLRTNPSNGKNAIFRGWILEICQISWKIRGESLNNSKFT